MITRHPRTLTVTWWVFETYTYFLSLGIKRPIIELIKSKNGRWRLPNTPSMCCISILHKFTHPPILPSLSHPPPPGLFLKVIQVLQQKAFLPSIIHIYLILHKFIKPKILIWSVYSLALSHLTINTPPSSWIILPGSSNSLLTITQIVCPMTRSRVEGFSKN